MPAWLPAAIAAGGSLLSSGINAVTQKKENERNRDFAREQYATQRRHALEDYQLQNEYNSPASQMARLKAAKLNPNLVYGNGADAQGGTVRASSTQSAQGIAPKVDIGGAATAGLNAYYSSQLQTAQIDNLKVQNTVLLEEQKLKAAQTLKLLADTDTTKFNYGVKTELRENTVAMARANYEKLVSGIRLQDNTAELNWEKMISERDFRPTRLNQMQQSINESTQRVLSMRIGAAKTAAETDAIKTQIENLQKDGRMKDLDAKLKALEIELKEKGTTWSDPAWQRRAILLLREFGL